MVTKAELMPPRVIKRSMVIAGHATSISLEEPFWRALKRLAADRGVSVAALVASLDQTRAQANLSSTIRVAVLADLEARLDQLSRG